MLLRVNLVVITLLSILAAVPKLIRVPQELDFFAGVGLGPAAVVIFGAIQLIGGVLLIRGKTRRLGAMITAAMFLGSAVMVLASGQWMFGIVSLVPVVLAMLLARSALRLTPSRPA